MRLRRPPGTFQPHNHTAPNRYPVIFRRAAEALRDCEQPRILSFGCSVGDELFSLRAYFPDAFIRGIDINRWNIVLCRIRLARARDRRIVVAVGSSTTREPAESYDAIFCMAVLRHGALGAPGVERSDPLLSFDDFARQTSDFARCLRPGGLLVLRNSNFRFSDTPAAADFELLARVPQPENAPRTPVFGPDNRLLPGVIDDEAIFRKRSR